MVSLNPRDTRPQLEIAGILHPACPHCGVKMWLTHVEYFGLPGISDRQHFECHACEATAILPPL
jgi:transposase-like protein